MRKFTNEMLIKLKTTIDKEEKCYESKYNMRMYCFDEDYLIRTSYYSSYMCMDGIPKNVGVIRKKYKKWFIVEDVEESDEWQIWYLINDEVKNLLEL